MIRKQTIILCVLDGWGIAPDGPYNAITKANTPHYNRLLNTCPHAVLETSGPSVGLPDGQMGNSEVGHMHLGAGRIILQTLPRIDKAFKAGLIEKMPAFLNFVETMRRKPQNHVHLMGLISPGGVHSHEDHWIALAKILSKNKIKTSLHLFLDGRDVAPCTALKSIKKVRLELSLESGKLLPCLSWGTISGRYYAMDRDQRWARTKQTYDAMVERTPEYVFPSPEEGIQHFYDQHLTDEFIPPFQVEACVPVHLSDGILMANFRADRVRQLLSAFLDPKFLEFKPRWTLSTALGMAAYSKRLDAFIPALIRPLKIKNHLGDYLSTLGKKQLRLAETEKYPHVTYFFNGGVEKAFDGEKRLMIPSPKVATYDLQPEMSSVNLTDQLLENLKPENAPDFVLINYANADMVGHTGNMKAAIWAVQAVDEALGRIIGAIEKHKASHDYTLLITADHGNCEAIYDPSTGMPHTAHTLNPVPLIVFSTKSFPVSLKNGSLKDIAPTLLAIMGLKKPIEMSGASLCKK